MIVVIPVTLSQRYVRSSLTKNNRLSIFVKMARQNMKSYTSLTIFAKMNIFI
ncbi:hypothetical protein SAMN05421542_2893 [Chryseobacterium jejuense]|uniref:Uncharacterized protein n=1 Tax=Chryseobacterium jejuense TaxID=445960 RepID=A0A2X2VG37_CHRJE|nr:hypothetical protein SAMN05421542_2893 [Chryseobacterium jejuense]SQB28126.1 Uncharacterised protein [Chryseobacterium jejuense]